MRSLRLAVFVAPLVLAACDGKKGNDGIDPQKPSHAASASASGSGRPDRERQARPAVVTQEITSSGDEAAAKRATTVARYAQEDPAAGLAWAKAIEDEKERHATLEQLAWSCVTTDLATALDAAEALPAGDKRQQVMSHLVAEWSVQDPAAALQWAKERNDPAERDEAITGWVTATGENSPADAATLAADEIRPGAVQNRAVVSVLQRWARKDYEGASKWVEDFPDGALKDDAMRELQAAAK
ncbi:hypothetical protein KBB96_07445 [Luteolibacter ambystomatis]|uniref:Uncharacterized protein n=1 Tax=Luteolibacter ambystomatis TaxID=2824561 RepID=A0A975PGG4_9BACT|nr:hypothetical protein [Luteolibacter ambystomatis]QUE52718.1 hypothetical protein KBB96_07445 [Luteolibacter ambystomatis]